MLKPGKFKRDICIAKEMAKSLNCLPAKRENLGSVPQNPCKNLDARVHAYCPGADSQTPEAHCLDSLTEPMSYLASMSPVIKTRGMMSKDDSRDCLLASP